MQIAVWFIAAILGWFVGGINLAVTLSKAIYHEDIRNRGSGNPGFTNFKRIYGNKYAWFVFAFDLLKGAILCLAFGIWFEYLGFDFQLGAAYTGLFVMLGHSFPIQYGFKGGKGFLVLLSELFVLDWRAGIIAFALMTALLLTVKYMSLATMCALTVGAAVLFVFKCNIPAAAIYAACVVFMVIRHRENIKRLKEGTESKFHLGSGR
ncbi:MAG: glycerol-3-phosphate acyltransferase [Clostridia bacterium]|nr:glycerol-3-phosphate acyltransferase [Clostridia bacterium]